MKKKIVEQGTMEKDKSKNKTPVKSKKKVAAQVFDDLQGKFLLVRVGTSSDPADGEQIKSIEKQLLDLFEKNKVDCLTFVTHHAVAMDIIGGKNGNGEV